MFVSWDSKQIYLIGTKTLFYQIVVKPPIYHNKSFQSWKVEEGVETMFLGKIQELSKAEHFRPVLSKTSLLLLPITFDKLFI